jgi:hypothetical protein
MQAELGQIESSQESLQWLAGGVMSLGKAWWNRILLSRDPNEVPAPVRAPGIISLLLLLVAVSSLALPGLRQGFMTVYDSWNFSHPNLQPAQLEKMGRQAETDHDATTLALVAMRLPGDSQEKNHWADLAVSLDPSLTWIYFQMRNPEQSDQSLNAETSAQIARLQKWDPDNAVPYLMEADEVFENFQRKSHYKFFGARSAMAAMAIELDKDPVWASAMDKAFRASRFDDYENKRFNLNLAIQEKMGTSRPIDLVLSTAASRWPNLLNLRLYSDWLIHEGTQREAGGDQAGATESYWLLAQFGQRMAIESRYDSIERLIALPMIAQSFEKLQSLYDRTGRTEEARYAAFEVANAKAGSKDLRRIFQQFSIARDTASWSGLTIYMTSLLILIAAALSCFSLIWLTVGSSGRRDSQSTLYRWFCVSGRFAPALLLFSVILFYVSYYPYLESFRNVTFQNMESLTFTFGGLYSLPLFLSYGSRGAIYFWSGVSIIGSLVVLIMIARMSFRWMSTKEAV